MPATSNPSGPATETATEPTAPTVQNRYSYEFIGTFDTLIQIIGYAPDQATFDQWSREAERQFRELHALFDAYNSHDSINNIKTINDQAGLAPVEVDPRIIDLLVQTRLWRSDLTTAVDLTLGPVVEVWNEYRTAALADPEKAGRPTEERLAVALFLKGDERVQIDTKASTVFLIESGMRLDVGAVAKGYATERVAQSLISMGVSSMIINAGGSSVRLIGKPDAPDRQTWNVAIHNPEVILPSPDYIPSEAAETLTVVRTTDVSIVTSGDYQRYYGIEDMVYHHLIDPQTGMPARHYRAVTVVTEDSGLADFLSTALFVMPYGDSRALVDRLDGVEAMWVFSDGRVEMTPGMEAITDPLPDYGF